MTKSFAGAVSSVLTVILCLAACGAPPTRERDGGTPTPTADAGVPTPGTDSGARPIDLGPLPNDPMLDATDRTRAASCPSSVDWVVAVRGRVLDERGAAIQGALVLPCLVLHGGRRICLRPTESDAGGVATAIFSEENRCVEEVALRILVPESNQASTYCAPRARSVDGVLIPALPLVLHDTERPSTRPPTGDESAMRAVVFRGVTLETTPRDIGVENYEAMGARILPGSLTTDTCLGDGTPMDLLVAFGPEAIVDVAAGLDAQIDGQGFSAGERVDLFVLGGMTAMLADGTELTEGEWHRFGTTTVLPDGTIHTPAADGLPHLGWIGLRRAP